MGNDSDPLDAPTVRVRLRELAEQLALEYAGAVAPGQVMSLVFVTARRLHRQGFSRDDLLRLTKASVRDALATGIGAVIAHGMLAHAAPALQGLSR